MRRLWILPWVLASLGLSVACGAEPALRVGVFNVSATPPLGGPVAYALARSIQDPLSARGIVLLGAGQPIVLCAVDWIGIGNTGQDEWRSQLANAAGTTPDRVTVHTLHQHDGCRCDFRAAELLAARGLSGQYYDAAFAREVIGRAAQAVTQALRDARPVTHLGVGQAQVEKVASNRRILGPDGKVKIVRYSKSTKPEAIAAPEGVIDPHLRTISFFQGEQPLVALSYYACHPQSYYGKGDVTAEFVGLARAQRQKELPGVPQVYFNGAAGNVAAGKYNDGSPEMRVTLTQRVAAAMRQAWENTVRTPIAASDVQWRVCPVRLPLAEHFSAEALQATLNDPQSTPRQCMSAATDLAWVERALAGRSIDLSCLRLGNAYILHMPGELFVEYQLAAQAMRPNDTVCMAAYGDYGPSYIGTEIAYSQGGYETSRNASNVAPGSEKVLLRAMRELLGLPESERH